MYKDARKKAGLSIEEAAFQVSLALPGDRNLAPRTLAKYEAGEITPDDTMAMAMAEAYGDHNLTALYCKRECAIGRKFCYEVLNNVDLSPVATLAKFAEEKKEVDALLDRLAGIVLNRRGRRSLSDREIGQLENDLLELLDLEHVIETLKLEMWEFVDISDLVQRHNAKCKQKAYVTCCQAKEKDRLQAAI